MLGLRAWALAVRHWLMQGHCLNIQGLPAAEQGRGSSRVSATQPCGLHQPSTPPLCPSPLPPALLSPQSNEEGLVLVSDAIKAAGYEGKVKIAMDCAATEFYGRQGLGLGQQALDGWWAAGTLFTG